MKPTKSILILLSLFLMFSCYPYSPSCEERSSYVDGVCVCDMGYTGDGYCYYQFDLDVLQDFIDNSQGGNNPPPSDLSPIELGVQEWEDGRLVEFCSSNTQWSNCYMDYQLTTLPESIGDLSSLEKLWLYSNQLTTLPESIGNLSSLDNLWLVDNQLTTLPESIGGLISLKELGLSINKLTSLPESIGNLTSLERLWLSSNQLTTLPESIGNLSSLTLLGLSSNQLTTLPESVGDLSSLEKLYLDSNQLTSIPESIWDLSSLERLWLSSNQLTTLPESIGNLSTLPESICNLTNLYWSSDCSVYSTCSSIYNNQLCSSIPTCIIDYLGEQDCDD